LDPFAVRSVACRSDLKDGRKPATVQPRPRHTEVRH
jgi:hypothetical protein